MELFLFILCGILLVLLIFKKHKYIEIDNETIEENEKLLKNKELILNEIKILNEKKEEKSKGLDEVEKIISNMNAAAREAFTQYQETLDQEYLNAEREHDKDVQELRQSYDNLQDILMLKVKQAQGDLDKISATRAAALEAQLKEQEIKDRLSFYCPQIPEDELKDVKTLRDIEYKLNNPRVLRMLI